MAGTIRKTSFIRRSLPAILLAAILAAFVGACSRQDRNQSAKETGDLQTRKGSARTLPDAGNRSRPLRIAAIVTTFFPSSHAGVIVDKFLRGFPTDEGVSPPRSKIVSLYIDQIHERDVGRQIAHENACRATKCGGPAKRTNGRSSWPMRR